MADTRLDSAPFDATRSAAHMSAATAGHTKAAVLRGIVAHLRHRINAPASTPPGGMTPERASELLPAYQRALSAVLQAPASA